MIVFLPQERFAYLFRAEGDLPAADRRLLREDEAIRREDPDPHAGLINLWCLPGWRSTLKGRWGEAPILYHHRSRAASPALVDGLLAALLTGLAVASLVGRVSQVRVTPAGDLRFREADALGIALLLLVTLPIAWRRRAPLLVLAVSGAVFFLYEALGYAPPPLPFAPLIALYSVAVAATAPTATGATAAMAVGVVAAAVTHRGPLTHDQFLAYLLSTVGAGVLGYGMQLRSRVATLEQQALRLAREQTDRTALAVRQEQARIARELHDIVAHNISVIVALAGAARRVADAEFEHARKALGSIEVTGREAMTELRRLLGVLRTDREGAERAPQPGLDRLPFLVAQVEQAGLPVLLIVKGTPRPLPAGIELSAYRIVQEALTNTLKHAGMTRAVVTLGYRDGYLELRISDDGRSSGAGLVPGQGLVGMQQRAALLGGELAAGPGPEGGFQVRAKLPVDGGRPLASRRGSGNPKGVPWRSGS
jgi:signal transduction histidine kinase